MFMLVSLYDIVPYQESTTLQTLPHSSSGRQHYLCKIADDRQRTTCMWRAQRYNPAAQWYNPAAQQQRQVIPFMCGWRVLAMLRRVACVSEPVTICHPTIPHVSAVLLLWVRVSIDAEK